MLVSKVSQIRTLFNNVPQHLLTGCSLQIKGPYSLYLHHYLLKFNRIFWALLAQS